MWAVKMRNSRQILLVKDDSFDAVMFSCVKSPVDTVKILSVK